MTFLALVPFVLCITRSRSSFGVVLVMESLVHGNIQLGIVIIVIIVGDD